MTRAFCGLPPPPRDCPHRQPDLLPACSPIRALTSVPCCAAVPVTMRSPALLAGVWQTRTDRYSEIRTAETASLRKVEMSYIGG